MKLFRITARHTAVNAPDGRVLTCWLSADSEENALTMCAEKGIVEVESIVDDTDTHPFGEKKEK